jgi:hypothetical protein
MAETQNINEQVKQEAAAIINDGTKIRERIANLVALGAEQAQASGEGLLGLAKSIMDTAATTVNQSLPADPNSTLRQVIDGLSDGVSSAALAAKMAVSESVSSGKSFAENDMQKFLSDVSTLREMYSQTVIDGLGKIKNLTGSQLGDLKNHALAAQSSVLPALQQAFDAAYQHPIELGKESVQTGVELTRQTVGSLFSAVGRLLQDAGSKITPEEKK